MHSERTYTRSIGCILETDPRYPDVFRALPAADRPQKLYFMGNTDLLQMPWVGFTGTTNPTKGAIAQTRVLAQHAWQQCGAVPTSGGAFGVDCAAHGAMVEIGAPTIIILPHVINPWGCPQKGGSKDGDTNWSLYMKAVDCGGLIISAYRTGDSWDKPNNPARTYRTLERNQLIARSFLLCAMQWEKEHCGTTSTMYRAKQYKREIWIPRPRPEDIAEHPGSVYHQMEYLRNGVKMQGCIEATQSTITLMKDRIHKLAQQYGMRH